MSGYGRYVNEAARKGMEELVDSVEKMRLRLMDDAETRFNDDVDHTFLKGVELLLIAAALGAVGLVGYARFLR